MTRDDQTDFGWAPNESPVQLRRQWRRRRPGIVWFVFFSLVLLAAYFIQ